MRSTSRTRKAGFWASWADCSPMIEARHPEVATKVIAGGSPARAQFEHTVWRACAVSKFPVGGHWLPVCVLLATGWQHEASSRIEQEHRETLFRVMAEPERALLRSQRWFWSWSSAADLSDMSSHSHRPRFVPCSAVAMFASPFAGVRALLPVWPSTRFPWSVRGGKDLSPSPRCKGGCSASRQLWQFLGRKMVQRRP